jgi:hypothetical protein
VQAATNQVEALLSISLPLRPEVSAKPLTRQRFATGEIHCKTAHAHSKLRGLTIHSRRATEVLMSAFHPLRTLGSVEHCPSPATFRKFPIKRVNRVTSVGFSCADPLAESRHLSTQVRVAGATASLVPTGSITPRRAPHIPERPGTSQHRVPPCIPFQPQ